MISAFEEIPRSEWSARALACDPLPTRAFKSKHFFVSEYQEGGGVIRLSICRIERTRSGDWADGISWDTLQAIKNELGFEDFEAVEVYPAAVDLVRLCNLRHLWVLPQKTAFSWKRIAPTGGPDA